MKVSRVKNRKVAIEFILHFFRTSSSSFDFWEQAYVILCVFSTLSNELSTEQVLKIFFWWIYMNSHARHNSIVETGIRNAARWQHVTSMGRLHGGVSAPSSGTFTHRVAFEEGSGPRVLLKSGSGNRGRSACGTTHVARLEFPRETGLILRCAGKAVALWSETLVMKVMVKH